MKKQEPKTQTITVAGITFSAEQVKSAVVNVQGREVTIGEPPVDTRKIGLVAEC